MSLKDEIIRIQDENPTLSYEEAEQMAQDLLESNADAAYDAWRERGVEI